MKNVGLGSIIWRLTTSLLIGCISAFTTSISSSFAQSNIVPDETLGATESSRVIFNFNGAANDGTYHFMKTLIIIIIFIQS
ncbi:hypothetical protein DSM106972_072300 [Dulcicalothrix desertica PCC 7102]|uniref:Uncharacterized protein n=1 Tax=Dulcicalothrix desertica PCC 7102 TaxID=232991 RepID=A0A433V3Z8_9CYAN|nr:hypothetical protein DSM106972_072300 [Dulcicalothrix desertica PCC 7102]TWH42339.1 hypothetical protein CAL7102_05984 [Dulcicalothrix desertica PCC 7102]